MLIESSSTIASATASIKAMAQRWENAVSTNALAFLDPRPPAKSEVPHRTTAPTLEAAGANWSGIHTRNEGSTRPRPAVLKKAFFGPAEAAATPKTVVQGELSGLAPW